MRRQLFRVSLLFLIYFFFFLTPPFILAKACGEKGETLEEAKQIELNCEQRLYQLASQHKTLSATLEYLNTQISLTQIQISRTQAELKILEKDLKNLGDRIADLNTSLDDLSQILVRHVRGTYSQSRLNDPVYLFFTSKGFTEFINRYQYLKAVQNNDKKIMKAMEVSRQNYNIQKTLKEQKQQEVEKLDLLQKQQQTKLTNQQTEKQHLLELTKNDEKKYQELLQEAAKQTQAFRRFVTSQGGASILNNQTKCDGWGCYYNQRDQEWGNQQLGISGLSTAEFGCLVTSVSMIASHYGKDVKPSDIAREPTAFWLESAYLLHNFTTKGVKINITTVNSSRLDEELSAGRPVIVGLYSGPDHFIVIKGKNDKGYIMNDPFMENGNDKPFDEKYKISDINSLRLVSFN